MLIQLFYALFFQIPKNHLGQWYHHCSHAKSQPFWPNHLSLTLHHLPWHCHNLSLVQTSILHSPSPVQIRTFPNTKRLLWDSKLVYENNCIHDDCLANIIL
jgi:hypothetical protein